MAESTSPRLPERTPSASSLHKAVPSHRPSFAENLRNPPSPSLRSQRHPSFSQSAIQELVNRPPPTRPADPKFAGRHWRDVQLGELLLDNVEWADMDTSVEDATKALLKPSKAHIVLIREHSSTDKAISYFDYNDLNAYILTVVGLAKPEEAYVALYDSLAVRARERVAIPLRDIQALCRHQPLVTLRQEDPLPAAIQAFGSGIHTVLIADQSWKVFGVLNQLQVTEFFWNEGIHFTAIERMYPVSLNELRIGTQQIIAINADSPLAEALMLMSNEGLSSVAVVDNGLNVVGNISTTDVRLLTSAASLPLLQGSCMHFITVLLTERGTDNGQDSFPVFYVNPHSTLAHTVAKLVATRSHRMWVVDSASPSPSAPATPLLGPQRTHSTTSSVSTTHEPNVASQGPTVLIPSMGSALATRTSAPPSPRPMPESPSFASSVPASAMAGARISGRLSGVVSLTDILNLFATSSGLHPTDPHQQREMRRRSSSSSVRPSIDGARSSSDIRR